MRIRRDPEAQVFTIEGRFDGTTVAGVRPKLHAAIELGDGRLVVDLSAVETIDVYGLGVLVGAHRKAVMAGRRLVLREVPPRVLRLLAATRLYRVLAIEPSRQRADYAVARSSTESLPLSYAN